ncbi:MAG: efflux RND transporter periplasmic adaptor subunit [Armatimonadetes bacterium]|nr:efflux RND transporter periplasmic adaptor subunit [Armatimonadota bacterium]
MNRLILLVAGLLLVTPLWFAYSRRAAAGEEHVHKTEAQAHEGEEHAEESPFAEVDAAAAKALGLRTETVFPGSLTTRLAATGRVVPVESKVAHLGSRIAGRLQSVRVRVGDRVAAGSVVATLDSVDAAQAAAAYREAVGRVQAAERNLAARRQWIASGSLTYAPLEDARWKLAEARLEQAGIQTALAQAGNELESARAGLSRVQRLAAGGTYTTAATEEARQKLAEAEKGVADARRGVADAEADQGEAEGAVAAARTKVQSAQELLERTTRLADTGELDRAPLEQAQNALADAKSRLQQAEVGLEQARRQLERGEELYRQELISLNEVESRRALVREREAQAQEAASAAGNAKSAGARQEQIAGAKMLSGRAVQEARNALAEAKSDLTAAEAHLAKASARVRAAQAAGPPAEAAVETAKASWQREAATAKDETRSATALDEARLRVSQAERALAGKQAEVAEAAHKVQVAAAAVTREERLSASHVRAREQLLETEREVRGARLAKQSAAEVLTLLGAEAEGRAGRLAIPIRAPFGGLVTELEAAVGEAVGPEKDLLTILDLSEVYLEADVYEKDLGRIRRGQTVRATFRSFAGEAFAGTVTSVSGSLDPQTCPIRPGDSGRACSPPSASPPARPPRC